MLWCWTHSDVAWSFTYRLKATISTLQQDVRESDVKLRQMLVTNIREQGSSAMEERLQVLLCTYTIMDG